jgi:hypothetical protein
MVNSRASWLVDRLIAIPCAVNRWIALLTAKMTANVPVWRG